MITNLQNTIYSLQRKFTLIIQMISWFGNMPKFLCRQLDLLLLITSTLLCISLFILVVNLEDKLYAVETYFQPTISNEEKAEMLSLLRQSIKQFDAYNVTYMMISGTLIGSYRHHGPIPWDDDIDLLLPENSKLIIREIVARSASQLQLFEGNILIGGWKLYNPNSRHTFPLHSFKWPYIDLYFYKENSTHIYSKYYAPMLKKYIFPIIKRHFADMQLSSPCNISYVLGHFNLQICKSSQFSHTSELPNWMWRQRSISCSKLKNKFPFVERSNVTKVFGANKHSYYYIVKETLMLGNKILHEIISKEPACTSSASSLY